MKRIPPKEGIFVNMPFSEYLLSEAWSSSDIRTLNLDWYLSLAKGGKKK